MDVLQIVGLLVIISAVFSFVNVKIVKLPGTIGVMTISILVSVLVLILGKSDKGIAGMIKSLTSSIDFSKILLDVMLGFLLFASALHFDFKKLKQQRRAIFTLSTIGVIISTLVFGFLLDGATTLLGIDLPLIYCLVFGALISPTDPIAVGAILKKSKIPGRLETIISGESMFNDAVGLILFVTLAGIASTAHTGSGFSWGEVLKLFGQEVIGGLAIGLIAGYLGCKLMRSINDFQTILLISIALVFAISATASRFHASVPLGVVAAGLVVGNQNFGKNNAVHKYLTEVWKLLDEVLNTILFVMIGLQLVTLPFLNNYWFIGALAILVVLIARLVSVILPAVFLVHKPSPGNLAILTWAGLRGGISVAMALSLPPSDYREPILAACYFIVVFSVIVQGLSLNKVVSLAVKNTDGPADAIRR